ncbi:MAG: hypothetical protein LBE74_01580 [Treponema sp.]|nr:hypothetical protein [Treponema sp.]
MKSRKLTARLAKPPIPSKNQRLWVPSFIRAATRLNRRITHAASFQCYRGKGFLSRS